MRNLLADPDVWILAQWSGVALWSHVWPYLLMLLGFSVIIFVHELGHFAVAKWAGVRVERFAIGFGREIIGFTRGGTRYSFNVLPLGGYVKMLGQEDFDDKAAELQFKDDPRSFINKPVWRRMVIVSAGVVMNIFLACLLFMIVFLVGVEVPGKRIAYVVPDSPAERAGLLPGDSIIKINGNNILEFREVFMAVLLSPLHEPIDFVIERDGELKSISVEPEYLIPENTREAQRLIVGISPGVTRRITVVGPEIDASRPDSPHVGDILVEIDGVEITDDNANEMIHALAYTRGDVYVERKDASNPEASPQRVHVNIPPILTLYPADDASGSVSVLGLAPLVRFDAVGLKGRAYLAGIDVGDTVLSWDDVTFPTRAIIARAIRQCPERDIHVKVRKRDGRIVEGFVRPKRNRRGPATIQAICEPIDKDDPSRGRNGAGAGSNGQETGPQVRFADVRRLGRADRAGIEPGDVVLSCLEIKNPTLAEVNRAIRSSAGRELRITVRKLDGRTVTTWVRPEAPGSIDARYKLVADDLLRVADIVPTIAGGPSPAAKAGIERGALITAVDGRPISRWRDLIDIFRANAGTTVELAYRDADESPHVARFDVPHCLRTLLGVGPEARILSVDGRRTVMIEMHRGREEVSVGYRKGTRTILTELIGRTRVPVEYRENPLTPVQTGYVDVTADMVNPWLAHVSFQANIDVAPELTLLKGENALDAIGIGLHKTYYFVLQVYKTLERMVFTRSISLENVSGPLGIIDIGGQIARAGLIDFIFFMGIISANLAVINFLPLPILDGGLMVFLIIEKIKGSPVSLRVQIATQMIGLFLIIGAFLYVTFNDAMRLWG